MKAIIPYIIIVILGYLLFTSKNAEVKDNTVTVYKSRTLLLPSVKGSFSYDKPKPYKVTEYVLDTTLVDSITKLNALLELAKVREYKKTYSDSLITFNIYSKVIGRLDSINVNYDLKERNVQYIETHTETKLTPKTSLFYGFGVSTDASLGLTVGAMNSKGNYLGLSYDTNNNFSIKFLRRFYVRY